MNYFTHRGESFTTGDLLLDYGYFIAAILFVIGLKYQSSPATARKGNLWAGGGMVLAILLTLFLQKDIHGNGIGLSNLVIILTVILIGTIIGSLIARKVKMTAMPQLVSFYNATGGAASALVALTEFYNPLNNQVLVTLLGVVVGNITFSGSMIAYGKLDGKVKDIFSPVMRYVNLFFLLLIVTLVISVLIPDLDPAIRKNLFLSLVFLSLVYGISFVMPIGGADMPVVISLLNSLSGIAAALAGFIYNNQAMILGGILVGAAGTILTILMCRCHEPFAD
ncbi:MAG: NAD(P)(+) transhydrogenase (Re/Si-specific) subunit beta [Bacteroidales bacterium]|nr:NAD(P)(+) transhydrogenase (Re/Si-specific) subunit beta [Bacteroidales bacterium]